MANGQVSIRLIADMHILDINILTCIKSMTGHWRCPLGRRLLHERCMLQWLCYVSRSDWVPIECVEGGGREERGKDRYSSDLLQIQSERHYVSRVQRLLY